nr:PAS domain-containing protein [Rhizobium sp. L1K21]
MTDPRINDNPLTYVNDAFQQLTLYSRDYAIGRNCRFLQGEQTEPDIALKIREGLQSGAEFEVTITNYKADGTPFLNQLLIAPVMGEDGELSAYFGVQREVQKKRDGECDDESLDLLRELQHRVKNHLSMVVSMIRLQAARPVTPESLKAVSRRVEALALLYEEMFDATMNNGEASRIHTGAYLSRIANVVSRIDGRTAIRINVESEEIELPVDHAARLGLLLSELLTNALEHAFKGRETGLIDIRFRGLSNGGVRLTVEDDGIGLPEDSNWPYEAKSVRTQKSLAEQQQGDLDTTGHNGHSGVGGTIIIALTQKLGATLNVNSALEGTTVTIDFEKEL